MTLTGPLGQKPGLLEVLKVNFFFNFISQTMSFLEFWMTNNNIILLRSTNWVMNLSYDHWLMRFLMLVESWGPLNICSTKYYSNDSHVLLEYIPL